MKDITDIKITKQQAEFISDIYKVVRKNSDSLSDKQMIDLLFFLANFFKKTEEDESKQKI